MIYSDERTTDLRDAENEIIGNLPSYTIADFAAGFGKDGWRLELFVSNAFDELAQVSRFAQCAETVCGDGGLRRAAASAHDRAQVLAGVLVGTRARTALSKGGSATIRPFLACSASRAAACSQRPQSLNVNRAPNVRGGSMKTSAYGPNWPVVAAASTASFSMFLTQSPRLQRSSGA